VASLIAGLVGGVVATVVVTAVMVAMGDGGPPPTARFVATVAGGEPEDHAVPGMALHAVYGVVAGAVFAVGLPLVAPALDSLAVAAAPGLVYGIVLVVLGMGLWMRPVIGIAPDRETTLTFGTVHVVYGLVLGAFLGAGVLAQFRPRATTRRPESPVRGSP
jgi:hypothetical protein